MRLRVLFFLALFFLPFDSIPFGVYGLPDLNPLTLIFLLLFVIVNLDSMLPKEIKKRYLIIAIIISFCLLVSFIKGIYEYREMTGFMTSVKTMCTFVPLSLVCISYVNNSKKYDIQKCLKILIISYSISLILGIIQLVSCYIPLSIFSNLFPYIFKNAVFVLEQNRIMFTFSEPSYIANHFFLVLLPIKNIIPQEKKDVYNKFLFIWFCVSIFSYSVTFYLLCTIYFIVNLYLYMPNTKKYLMFKFFIIFFLVLSIFVLSTGVLRKLNNVYITRMNDLFDVVISGTNIFESGKSSGGDVSTTTRLAYYLFAIKGFAKRLFLGYGMGYGKECFSDLFYSMPLSVQNNPELKVYLENNSYMFLGGFFGDTLVCTGILGIVLIFLILNKYTNDKSIKMSEKLVFLFILFQSNFFGNLILLPYMFLRSNKVNSKISHLKGWI